MASDVQQSPPNDEFYRFKDLPKELRLQIWEASLPGPRIVYLDYLKLKQYRCSRVRSDKEINKVDENGIPDFDFIPSDTYQEDSGPLDNYYGFKSKSPPPHILSVCREAHEVVSKSYSRAFGTAHTFPETWFDFSKDTLYLDWGRRHLRLYTSSDFPRTDLARVKFLALHEIENWYKICSYESHEQWLAFLLRDFPKVENVRLNWHSPMYGRGETGDLVFQRPVRKGTRDYLWRFEEDNGLFRVSAVTEEGDEALAVDSEKFQECRVGKGGNEVLSVPQIEGRMITSPRVKEMLLKMEKLSQKWSEEN